MDDSSDHTIKLSIIKKFVYNLMRRYVLLRTYYYELIVKIHRGKFKMYEMSVPQEMVVFQKICVWMCIAHV
jgi:hypothetical protein